MAYVCVHIGGARGSGESDALTVELQVAHGAVVVAESVAGYIVGPAFDVGCGELGAGRYVVDARPAAALECSGGDDVEPVEGCG